MVGRPTRIAMACTLAAAPLLSSIGAAEATDIPRGDVLFVSPGKGTPIQDAVDRARPGDTIVVRPGHYRENVRITKALTIVGSGMHHGGTVLTPPKKARKDACAGTAGFCITNRAPSTRSRAAKPLKNVTLQGFKISGFSGSGVLGMNTRNLVVEWVRAVKNHQYGIASVAGTKTRVAHNVTSGSRQAGIYVGDSRKASAVVDDNMTSGNSYGIALRDSTVVTAKRNTVSGNCIGVLLLNSGRGKVAAGELTLHHNTVERNTRACPGGKRAPASSGVGIALAGVHDTYVHHNNVRLNEPSGPSIASGGIALFSTKAMGGAVPINNRITDNVVSNNRPYDLSWDQSSRAAGGNVFSGNSTVAPGSLGAG
jgi:parallel beta-helix repeat protein